MWIIQLLVWDFMPGPPAVLLVFEKCLADYPCTDMQDAGYATRGNPFHPESWFGVKKLLCVDDSPVMLATLVEMLAPEFTIVGTLSSGASALAEAASLNPDIILLDVDLGDMTGFFVAKQLKNSGCPASIVILSVHDSVDFAEAALNAGASGYVCKSHITRDLVNTLRKAS